MTTITPRQLHERLQKDEKLHLLDVRTPAEHAKIHVPNVHLAPLDRLDPAQLASVNGFAKDQPVFLLFSKIGLKFVDPAFIWLSGFVGAGLMFAGITDTCAMGIMIAKLPWNQRGSASCCTK